MTKETDLANIRLRFGQAYRCGMAIRVECYAGYRGEQEPLAFWLGKRRLAVRAVIDRWFAPTQRWFKVDPTTATCTSFDTMRQAQIGNLPPIEARHADLARGRSLVTFATGLVDPMEPVDFSESRRSSVLKVTFDANRRPTAKWLPDPFREMVLALKRHF